MHSALDWGRVLTAMVTPFDSEGRLALDALPPLVGHLFETGSDGLVVCGTTGESPTLNHDEKLALFERSKALAAGRGPVIAGVGSNDTAASVALARDAASIGVDGLLLVAPYYNRPSQEGMYRHFKAIAESVSIPSLLYNVPGRTASNLEAQTVLRLARDVPQIVAVKEASGNLLQATEIVAGAPEGFRLYSGEDALTLPLLSIGGHGVVSVTSHVVGREMAELHRAFFAGEHGEAARLHAFMLPVVRALFQSTTPSPVPLKAALGLLGLSMGPPRLPLVEANEREIAIVRDALRACGRL